MGLKGINNEEKIWNYLIGEELTTFGAAALMGNLFAESGLNPANLQNTYEKKLKYNDANYTAAVDSGEYKNFVYDSAGYGLAQWTHWSRKKKLLEYAKTRSESIGDLELQLEFLIKELESLFPAVISLLRRADDVREASDCVLLKFERPADQSETAKQRRAGYGQKYYDKFAGTKEDKPLQPPEIKVETPTIEPPKTDAQSYTEYAVKRGDTLAKIAAKYKTTYKELAAFNGLSNPNLIRVGQVIKIPCEWTPKVGDIVYYNGNVHYSNAGALVGKKCIGGQARIAAIYGLGKAKHPYQLIRVAGKGATVYGWVNEGTFTKA